MKMNFGILLTVLLAIVPSMASAQKIGHTIRNFSFEANQVASGGYTPGKPDNWTEFIVDGQDSFIENIEGFNGHGANHIGLAAFNYLYQDIVSRETIPAKIAMDERPIAGRRYSLIVSVGNRPGWTQPGNISLIQLQLVTPGGAQTVAERRVDASTIPSGTFRTFSAAYTATSDAPPGSKFRIWLQVLSGDRAHFDDVQMVSHVPSDVPDQHTQAPPFSQATIPIMNSAAGWSKVLYLDFDGEANIPAMAEWNGGEPLPPLAHSGLSTLEIQRAFEVVTDDYSPFQINVTTDPNRYWSAPPGSRMRVIVTPTDTWNYREMGLNDAGNTGQAPQRPWESWLDALNTLRANTGFQDSGTRFHREVPTFVWVREWVGGAPYPFGNTPNDNGRQTGHWISHESGHAFGLVHDSISGDDYYNGQGPLTPMSLRVGSTGSMDAPLWAPIMGDAGLLTQWNKGEWNNVVNDGLPIQDDVAIIASQLGYVTDANDAFGTATALPITGSTFSGSGIISKTPSGTDDVDYFSVTLPQKATISMVCKPAEPFADSNLLTQQAMNSGIASLYLFAQLYRPDQGFCCDGVRGASTPTVPISPTAQEQLNPTEFLRVYLNRSLDPGTYYIKVLPLPYGSPATNGFSNHGNMGAFSIAGSIDWIEPLIINPLQATGVVNQPFNFYLSSDQSPVTWTVTNRPAWMSLDSSSGLLSGTPASGGTFVLGVRAGNSATISAEENLTITITVPAAPTILSPTSITAEEGVYFSVPIVATENPISYGYTGGIVAGLDVHAGTGLIFGTPTIPTSSTSVTFTATSNYGIGSLSVPITIRPSPPTALDNTVLAFNRPDAKKWFGQKVESWDGVDSMQSPALNHSESSTIETTVAGPGTINYYWKANSEIGDVLSLRVGANTLDSVSGSTGWVSRTQSVPAGVQTLRWTFTRNASGDGGSNSVWLDRVSFTGATGPTMTFPLNVNWTVGQLYYVNLTSDDPATVWTVSDPLPDGVGFFNNAILAVPHLPGTRSFTIFATSSLGTTTRAFTMYVQSSYTAWAITNGLGAGSELGDADKDGLNNFAELALVLDPFVRNNDYQPVSYDPATKRLRAVFKILSSQYNPDIKYEVQVSPNLQTWTTIAQGYGNSQIENLGGAQSVSTTNGQQFTVIDGTAQTAAVPKRWMRVKVSQLK